MKICIPIEKNEGMQARVYGHFGSAPHFALFDTGTRDLEVINNGDMHHGHGQCNPIGALSGRSVDVLVTGGIGSRAIERLGSMGIKVCLIRTEETVADVIRSHEAGTLRDIEPGQCCSHHSCS